MAPLFETLDDLHNAPTTIETLLSSQWYLDHINTLHGGIQECMIGAHAHILILMLISIYIIIDINIDINIDICSYSLLHYFCICVMLCGCNERIYTKRMMVVV